MSTIELQGGSQIIGKLALRYALVASAALYLPACAIQVGNQPQRRELEIETPEQQVLAEINGTQTEFTVPLEDSTAAWSRARTFFLQYLGFTRDTLAEEKRSERDTLLSNRTSPRGRYLYEVSKTVTDHGYRFRVACRPRTGSGTRSTAAEQNSRNVARFIQTGTLELAYLDR